MQDRYTGDVGDFGKYGLLRRLSGSDPRLSLGVVWYRTDDEVVSRDPPNDGRHITYLRPERSHLFQPCDPDLFTAMKTLVEAGGRSVGAVERSAVLPFDTAYYAAPLRAPLAARPHGRLQLRDEWLSAAAATVRDKDIVFIDPDNGLETPSVPPHSTRAPKYAFLNDLDIILRPAQTLVAYHHLGRTSHIAEVQRRLAKLGQYVGRPMFALRFRRGTSRAFLIATAPGQDELLRRRARQMLAGPWKAHFDWIDAS